MKLEHPEIPGLAGTFKRLTKDLTPADWDAIIEHYHSMSPEQRRAVRADSFDWHELAHELYHQQERIVKKVPFVRKRLKESQRDLLSGRPLARSIRTPSEALAERHLLVSEILLQTLDPKSRIDDDDGFRNYGLCVSALNSQPFLWMQKMIDMAHSMTVPPHVFGADGWPYPMMWWTFENQFPIANPRGERQTEFVQAFCLIQVPSGIEIFVVTYDGIGNVKTLQDFMRFGDRITGTSTRIDVSILKMISFLNSKYISMAPQSLTKHEIRALKRTDYATQAEQTVRVVKLRAKQTNPGDEHTEDDAKRDWAGRWWVRGHIRAQWCPSSRTHKLIWIAPYLKGPEDKPIIEKLYAVVR